MFYYQIKDFSNLETFCWEFYPFIFRVTKYFADNFILSYSLCVRTYNKDQFFKWRLLNISSFHIQSPEAPRKSFLPVHRCGFFRESCWEERRRSQPDGTPTPWWPLPLCCCWSLPHSLQLSGGDSVTLWPHYNYN